MAPSLPSEMRRHFRPDFIAALSDARPDRGMQVAGVAAEPLVQCLDGARRDLRHGATPAGMYGRHGAPPLVDEQDRNAIGRLHGNDGILLVLEQRIALA